MPRWGRTEHPGHTGRRTDGWGARALAKAMLLLLLCAAAAVACGSVSADSLPAQAAADPPATDVFHANLANTSCYRIPSIVQTTSGALVASAEARVGSCGDGAVHSIAVRSSVDNGTTWGDVSFIKGPGGGMIGNPTAFATKTGKIV